VEVLLVVTIIGIAAAMIIPGLSGMGDIQATSAARAVLADMQYAQNEAIVTQQPITVAFDLADESYELRNAGGAPLVHPITKAGFSIHFPTARGLEKVQILSADFGGNVSVTFDTLGSPDNDGQVTVGADGNTYRITVAPVTGKVSVSAVGS